MKLSKSTVVTVSTIILNVLTRVDGTFVVYCTSTRTVLESTVVCLVNGRHDLWSPYSVPGNG